MPTMTMHDLRSRATAWIVPPKCQGQIVEVAYAYDSDADGVVFRRVSDRSDGTTTYAVASLDDCGCDGECACFDPINSEPDGFDWTEIEIEE
jgi:hypothetical protein